MVITALAPKREGEDNSLKKASVSSITGLSASRAVGLVVTSMIIAFVMFSTLAMQSEQASRHVKTDKAQYLYGEPVIVSGNVGQIIENRTVWLVVQHTTGETVHRDESVFPAPDGTFSKTFNLSMLDREGRYFAYMSYGNVERDAEFMYYIPDSLRTYHAVQVSYALAGKLVEIHGRSTEGIEPVKLTGGINGLDLRLEAQQDGFIELAFPKILIDGAGVYGISVEDYTTSYPHPFSSVTTNSTHDLVKQFIPKDAWAAHLGLTYMAANPSYEELIECEQLSIEPENCTRDAIDAKRASMENPPEPPVVGGDLLTLVAQSQNNKYEAQVEWHLNDFGSPSGFHVAIFNMSEPEPRAPAKVYHDFRISNGHQDMIPKKALGDDDYIDDYSFEFPEAGSYTLIVSVVEPQDNIERIEIPIQVTPEFSVITGLSITLVGSVIAAVMVTRTRSFNLG